MAVSAAPAHISHSGLVGRARRPLQTSQAKCAGSWQGWLSRRPSHRAPGPSQACATAWASRRRSASQGGRWGWWRGRYAECGGMGDPVRFAILANLHGVRVCRVHLLGALKGLGFWGDEALAHCLGERSGNFRQRGWWRRNRVRQRPEGQSAGGAETVQGGAEVVQGWRRAGCVVRRAQHAWVRASRFPVFPHRGKWPLGPRSGVQGRPNGHSGWRRAPSAPWRGGCGL